MRTDADLYRRGIATLLASWEEYARAAAGATVMRLPGVAAAVFPDGPERGVYNNAVLNRGLAPAALADAVSAMEAAYSAAGIDRFAAWVHETEAATAAELERRGYTVAETTRAMGMDLESIPLPRPHAGVRQSDWAEYLRVDKLPPGLLASVDPDAFRVVVGRLDGESIAAGIALERDGDCGIYNLGTKERARRRGMGTAVTAELVHAARDRGCETASLQSTPIAERVYASVGFRDLGRILEYAPPGAGGSARHVAKRRAALEEGPADASPARPPLHDVTQPSRKPPNVVTHDRQVSAAPELDRTLVCDGEDRALRRRAHDAASPRKEGPAGEPWVPPR